MSATPELARRTVVRLGRILRFTGYFAVRLVQANLAVAWEILTPGSRLEPAVVRVPLRAGTDVEVAAVALAVSLTPGTLTLAIRREPATLWVHGVYAADPVAFRREVTELEWRVLAAIRPATHPVGGGRPDDDGSSDDGGPSENDPPETWRWR
ncbi:Na+/H+ antiporter subunit E [Micromonospora craniellae]|uniref:Cation transporter n=1 Tax=Micromonospora craniellae TaxID=2294034 RepID=A0A372G2J2_9ACTN|nr:Na+/H+ antiporter subunit E [Micromonospora craniellae]QOC91068.1 Na+/H+ antiporter subunit E [Micromonospora craniellae]RFS47193.1 cation transporter [Micromonospora craniellae]